MTAAAPATALRDDPATVTALAAMAACTTDLAHEALGHGSACLLSGGHIALLNDAFFRCSAASIWVAPAGPAFNLLTGLVAFALQSLIPRDRPALRFYALCVMAFSLFWEAGYLIYAMVNNTGDLVFAWRDFVGRTDWSVRTAGAILGIAGYFLFTRMLGLRARTFADVPGRAEASQRLAWATGVLVLGLSGLLFAPNRFGAMHDAGLSIVGSFPLLFPYRGKRPSPGAAAAPITRDGRILALALIVVAIFAATMGRGLT